MTLIQSAKLNGLDPYAYLSDEYHNINCGTYILATYNNKAGSWPKALAYYNVGPTGYNSSPKMKKQGEKYARQVKQHHNTLKGAL